MGVYGAQTRASTTCQALTRGCHTPWSGNQGRSEPVCHQAPLIMKDTPCALPLNVNTHPCA